MRYAKEKTVIILGAILVLLPISGFPRSWKTFISFVIGVVVIYMGLLFYRTARGINTQKRSSEIKNETFTETA